MTRLDCMLYVCTLQSLMCIWVAYRIQKLIFFCFWKNNILNCTTSAVQRYDNVEYIICDFVLISRPLYSSNNAHEKQKIIIKTHSLNVKCMYKL